MIEGECRGADIQSRDIAKELGYPILLPNGIHMVELQVLLEINKCVIML